MGAARPFRCRFVFISFQNATFSGKGRIHVGRGRCYQGGMVNALRAFVFLGMAALGVGSASALDYRAEGRAQLSGFQLQSASPFSANVGAVDTIVAGVPGEYAAAMSWYRVALTSGFQPPIVSAAWIYGEQLPEPLQYAWRTQNGDLITRIGKGAFRLSFEDSRNNWFRELNCRMVSWPGGDAQAVMNCEDGTLRTMLIPEEGGVVVDNVQYQRAFQQQQPNFDEALPDGAVLPEGEAAFPDDDLSQGTE